MYGNDNVDGDRVAIFLVKQAKSRKEAGEKWTWWVWDSYVKAIRDLQVDQEQTGRPATKAIRENPTVAQMADNLQREIHSYRKSSCRDRQAGTRGDGYSPEDKSNMAYFWLQQNRNMPSCVKHRAMFLTSDQSLVRGDDARSWQLCDMFMTSISPSYAGPSQAFVMGMLIKNGKQNKHGRMEYA